MKKHTQRLTVMVLLIICLTVCFLPGCGSKENTAQTETSQEILEETVEEV